MGYDDLLRFLRVTDFGRLVGTWEILSAVTHL